MRIPKFTPLALVLCLFLTGCAGTNRLPSEPQPEPPAQTEQQPSAQPQAPESPEAPASGDAGRVVRVDGQLYYDTGARSTLTGRCGTPDGWIDSSVDSGQTPAQDGQSNFGSGYPYQYGEPGTIEINLDGGWTVFAVREPAGPDT